MKLQIARLYSEDGKSGLTVEINNIPDLKEKIESLINNSEKLTNMEIQRCN
jgi:hypothetical protein